ncbi:MAG: M3 family peptidase [Gammaproteobacteria bacterium]|nr:M3 family peptidase [Gammaproteobacteria bacterium]
MNVSDNPLLITAGFPAYDRIEPGQIEPAVTEILQRARELLQESENAASATWPALMDPLEKIDLLLEYGWSPIGHLLSVANSDELRTAHEASMPKIVEFGLQLRQSEKIYRKLRELRDSPQWRRFSTAQQRIVKRLMQEAELSGITLQGDPRLRFNQIEQTLSQQATSFSNNLLDATKAYFLDITDPAASAGFPPSLKRIAASSWSLANADQVAASDELGPWRITLDAPCFGPFMEHCRDRELRETVYRAYITRASDGATDNTPLLVEILKLRHEKATLLGFKSYAELSLSQKMAGTVNAVDQLHSRLLGAAFTSAQEELDDLTHYAQQQGQVGALAHWDIAYWAERLREQRFSMTDEELRPYFSLDRVLNGLFELCFRLFSVLVRPATGKAPVWHADVRFYEIYDDSGRQIASFYLDPYSRPLNKRGGAWMNDCIARSVGPQGVRLPVAHLVCNSTPPTGDTPSLMTFREVETLFHEFGHGLQHMLTTVEFRDAAGIAGIEWDAVELPSQFMENWCLHRPTLTSMAIHYQTSEPLPEAYYRKLCEAKNYRAASNMVRQLQFGMTDLALHQSYDPNGGETPFEIERRIAARTSPLPPLPESRFLCAFAHIFAGGYAAGYYSYKWAEVLSADAYAAFEDVGFDNEDGIAAMGRRFRDTILAQGGSRHPMEIFQDFRGRAPNPQALLRHSGLVRT